MSDDTSITRWIRGAEEGDSHAQEIQRLLQELEDPGLQGVVLARMEACTIREMAGRFGCSRHSVQRSLHIIRTLWQREMSDETEP